MSLDSALLSRQGPGHKLLGATLTQPRSHRALGLQRPRNHTHQLLLLSKNKTRKSFSSDLVCMCSPIFNTSRGGAGMVTPLWWPGTRGILGSMICQGHAPVTQSTCKLRATYPTSSQLPETQPPYAFGHTGTQVQSMHGAPPQHRPPSSRLTSAG